MGATSYLDATAVSNFFVAPVEIIRSCCLSSLKYFLKLRTIPLISSHTRTVVRECFKGDEASQWKRPKFDPSPHQNPLTDLHKNWQA